MTFCRKLKKWSSIILLGSLTTFFFQNCADYKLQQLEEPSVPLEIQSKFCLKPPESKTKWSKVVFVMDVTGSNLTSDPGKERRLAAINTFVNKYRSEEYYKWSLITFQADNVQGLVNDGVKPTFDDINALDAAIEEFSNINDSSQTPYLSALGMVNLLIANDIKEHPEEISTYNIFFVSDGRPTDTDNCGESTCPDITLQIEQAINRSPGNIFLSTVYYYGTQIDPINASGMEAMAQLGGGSYSNAGAGEEIVFNEVKVGERPEPWVIKGSKLIAYNLNSGFCTDGSIDADSDADGICDKDEIKYNTIYAQRLEQNWGGKKFDPLNRNSFDEKYSDAFVWKFDLTANAGGLSNCPVLEDDSDDDYLNNCEELMLKDATNANGPTTQWTEYLLNAKGGSADPNNFDSDGDLFLDFMEFFQFRLESGISAAVDYLSRETVYPGGITAEQLMLEHRHFVNSAQDTTPHYSVTTIPLGIDESSGMQCYDFKLDPIPIYDTQKVSSRDVSSIRELKHDDGENLVLIYFIATQEDQRHGLGVLYKTIRPLKFGVDEGKVINLKIDDFDSVKAIGTFSN